MKRFNVRLPVILALSFCAGIFTAIILYVYNMTVVWVVLSFVPCALIAAVWTLIKRKIVKPSLFVFLPMALFITGAVSCNSSLTRYAKTDILPDTYYNIRGTVIEKGLTSYGEYIVLGDVTADGRKIDGKLTAFLSSSYGEFCDEGYTVEFYGKPEAENVFEYGKLNYLAEDNIKYSVNVNGGLSSTYHYSLLGSIRSSLKDKLFGNLSRETAAVTFAMLTGNVQYISEKSLETFRYGGIAHIFAVSGLHVGIVYGVILFICKKVKLNKYVSAALCLAFIAFYVALCGFTVSSVRAAIMCAVATAAKLLMQKYDGLNSLSVAVIVILAVSPLSFFAAGFRLTVCAVAGILLFSKQYEKFFEKLKIPQKISTAAGVSLGTQTATSPVLLANFGYLSGAGLILNILVIPLLSVIFAIIFAAAVLSMIIPPLAQFIIPYAALPLECFMSLIIGLGFEKSLVSGFGAGWFVPIYLLGALFLSDKLNLKTVTRIAAASVSAVILASYVLARYGYPYSGYNVIVSAYGSGGEVIIKSGYGTMLIVTDDVNVDNLKSALHENYITDIDAVVILGEHGAENFLRLDIDCHTIYLNASPLPIQPYSGYTLTYESRFDACGVNCEFFDDGTLLVKAGGFDIGICAGENFALPDCDILITDEQNTFINCRREIYFNKPYGKYSVLQCGDVSIGIDNGVSEIKTILPPRS